MVLSNPRAGDAFSGSRAYNHLPFNTGVHELPISYICPSPDGDTNCPIPTGYNCQLRNSNCAEGSSPWYGGGMTTPLTFEDGYIRVPTADGGEVWYCVVCIAPDGSTIACQDGKRAIYANDLCSSPNPSPGFSLSDSPPGDITLPFDSSTPEAKLQANTKTFYKDVSGQTASWLDYCRNAISTCKLVDMSGSDITIPNLRLGDKQDYFNLYLTMVSEG